MIFITGHHDTGKSTLAKLLTKNGFLHVETGAVIKQIYINSGSGLSLGEWAKQNNHDFDDYIIDEVKASKDLALRKNGQDVVITGNRQVEGINKIRQSVEPIDRKGHVVIYLETRPKVLFHRHQQRPDRHVEGLTLNVFKTEILGYDQEMGVERIKDMADVVLCNNSDISQLYLHFSNKLNLYGYQLNPPVER